MNLIEKLINEHGSSTILKERLQLAADQYSILEQKVSTLEQQITMIESENQHLKRQLDQAKEEVESLNKIIDASTKSQGANELKDVEKKILVYLFKNNSYFPIENIASLIGSDSSTAKYHVNNLIEQGLLYNSLRVGGPTTYKINDNGIKYVVETGLA